MPAFDLLFGCLNSELENPNVRCMGKTLAYSMTLVTFHCVTLHFTQEMFIMKYVNSQNKIHGTFRKASNDFAHGYMPH